MDYLCRHLEKRYYQRNETLYFQGQPADYVYIVKKGEFELTKPLRQQYSKNTSRILSLLGKNLEQAGAVNMLGKCLPEMTK